MNNLVRIWRTCIAPLRGVAPPLAGGPVSDSTQPIAGAQRRQGRPAGPDRRSPASHLLRRRKGRNQARKVSRRQETSSNQKSVDRIAASARSCPKRFLFLSTSSTLNLALIVKLKTACPLSRITHQVFGYYPAVTRSTSRPRSSPQVPKAGTVR
jgi:hypothetical protein